MAVLDQHPKCIAMTEIDANKFRKEAEECREQAAKAISADDKETWLRLAGDWMKLAQEAENRSRNRSPLSE
ncbi:hypothetical protein IVB16_21560 [Bradyrhizobium sp. 183]|uniref:hypothetical protein n=1 Tax=unclassified Bradyrhizobium TaxID=2631580 RepID=UPI001FFE4141|nr:MULTISPECIES: hypothetical protein [unclassified Bradyrhizobium]UPJ84459.1 hypothetical protein IVB17_21555 [Bradyrhizobium sp. 184]UPJ92255.1 hypothetical protein IVB16_21560 [Bradyrhizobium sp. 183]